MNLKGWDYVYITIAVIAFGIDTFYYKNPPSLVMLILALIVVILLSMANTINELKDKIK